MPGAKPRRKERPFSSSAREWRASGGRLSPSPWASTTTTSWTPAASAPSTAALTSPTIRRQAASCSGPPARVCSGRATPATPSMSAETKSRTPGSAGVPPDDTVLALPLLLVEMAVLEVSDADGRRLAQRDPVLRAVVHVAVEVVHAEGTAALLVQLFQVGAATHRRSKLTMDAPPPLGAPIGPVHWDSGGGG